MKRLTMLCWFIASMHFNLLFAQTSSWKFRHDHNGVQVYTRKDTTSGILELKLRTEVRASLRAVVALASDIPNLKDWAFRLKESYNIRSISETEGYLYMRTDFPLPFSDRDMIVHYTFKQDPHTKQVTSTSKSAHNLIPEKEGIVRIKVIESKWTYTPLPGGMTRLEYQLKSDPGGSIPKWLINLAVDDGPVKSILGLKQQLGKYEQATVGFLKE